MQEVWVRSGQGTKIPHASEKLSLCPKPLNLRASITEARMLQLRSVLDTWVNKYFLKVEWWFRDGGGENGVSDLWVHFARWICSEDGWWWRLFSSVTPSCPTLSDPMDCSMPGFPVHHQFPKLAQTHVHWVSDAIQPSYPLSSPSPPAFNLSQHQGLFQGVSSSHQVAKVLEFQI